jgi:transposase
MTFFLGFDTAKTKYDVSLVDEQGHEQWADTVANDELDVTEFLLSVTGHYVGDSITCVVESTGTYHHPLLEACDLLGMPCLVYNPLLTKQQIKATIRGKKTDRTDATMIARLGLRGEGRLHTIEPYRMVKHQVRSVHKLTALNSSVQFHMDHMTKVLGEELSDTTKELMQAIQSSIAKARQQLYQDIASSADSEIYSLLQTITGIGPYVAASLIGEVQTMERFPTAKSLIAYAGLDPKIRQSGKVLNSTGKLTKRGSPHLRRSIFIAASVARQFDPSLKALYDKKRSEGKSYTVATCVVARKLLAITRRVWLSGQAYDPNFFPQKLTKRLDNSI